MYVTTAHSVLLLRRITIYEYTKIDLSVLLLMDNF